MNRIVDRTREYQDRRAAHHRHPLATIAANKLAAERVASKAAASAHPFLRALTARAAHQLQATDSTSTERQAVLRRLGGQDE